MKLSDQIFGGSIEKHMNSIHEGKFQRGSTSSISTISWWAHHELGRGA